MSRAGARPLRRRRAVLAPRFARYLRLRHLAYGPFESGLPARAQTDASVPAVVSWPAASTSALRIATLPPQRPFSFSFRARFPLSQGAVFVR